MAVYVLGIVVEAAMYELTFVSPYVERPVTCDAGSDRFGSVVILATDVVAASWLMNRASNNELEKNLFVDPSTRLSVLIPREDVAIC